MNSGFEYLDHYNVADDMRDCFSDCYLAALKTTINDSPLLDGANQLLMVLNATSVPSVIFTSLPLAYAKTLFSLFRVTFFIVFTYPHFLFCCF